MAHNPLLLQYANVHDINQERAMNNLFRRFAIATAELVGSSWAFIAATALIVAWALSGPLFQFSDTWELVINTVTTIITFLMVFLIQNAQNRDAKALHLKLDELIRSVEGARNGFVDLEDLTDEELARLQEEFRRMREGKQQSPADTPATSADATA
jgi:low affinity Fe/Cu permease